MFDEETPYNLIEQLMPDLIVKGGDYTVEEIVGHDLVPVHIIPTVEGHSTTDIIEASNENINNRPEGFIGQNLGAYLQSKGHNVEGFEWKPNIIPDPEPYDRVIHLGAISSTTERDVEKIMEQNYEFSMRLLQLCDQKGTTFMYASSASVYGDKFAENSKLQPQSPYAWSKYLFDRFVMQVPEFMINVQGFRFFNVYGEGEEHKGDQASPYTKFAYQAKDNGVIKLFEDSNNYLRDFVCVDDICKLLKSLLMLIIQIYGMLVQAHLVHLWTLLNCMLKSIMLRLKKYLCQKTLKGSTSITPVQTIRS